jgi:hypothetical protein
MNEVRLRVQWDGAIELLELRFSDLREDKRLKVPTRERWDEEDLVVHYRPRCVRHHVEADGTRRIHLDYREEDHRGDLEEWIRKQVRWGRTELTFRKDRVTVRWLEGGVEKPVAAPCRILDDELWREERMVEKMVRERPRQQQLRRHLLGMDPRCALSEESIRAVLDVAHVIRHSDKGNASDRNALLLRADIHRLLDAPKTQPEWLRIRQDGTVHLSPALQANERYNDLDRIRSNDTLDRVRKALGVAARAA